MTAQKRHNLKYITLFFSFLSPLFLFFSFIYLKNNHYCTFLNQYVSYDFCWRFFILGSMHLKLFADPDPFHISTESFSWIIFMLTLTCTEEGGGCYTPPALYSKTKGNPYKKILDFSELFAADAPMKIFFKISLNLSEDSCFWSVKLPMH